MKKFMAILAATVAVALSFVSCNKNGLGPDGTLNGTTWVASQTYSEEGVSVSVSVSLSFTKSDFDTVKFDGSIEGMGFLKERVSRLGILGIVLAFVALVCFALPDNTDGGAAKSWIWIVYASVVFICWGIQAFVMKLANNSTPDAESVFVYMTIAAVLLIPVALLMGDGSCITSQGWGELTKVFFVQILNSIGAFTLVYANRYGKAMIVAPLADACAPVIMCVISLILYAAVPTVPQIIGIVAAISCVLIFSRE